MQILIPEDFPDPKFRFGEQVAVTDPEGYGCNGGRVVGMAYTSVHAALAEHSAPGWRYVLEVDPFAHGFKPHQQFDENQLTT